MRRPSFRILTTCLNATAAVVLGRALIALFPALLFMPPGAAALDFCTEVCGPQADCADQCLVCKPPFTPDGYCVNGTKVITCGNIGGGCCKPRTCEGRCGVVTDGCGHSIDCGACAPPCVPKGCGNRCGIVSDGCNRDIDCGACPTCNGNGVCEPGEPLTCGDCVANPTCGNGAADPGEDCSNCPGDVALQPTFTIAAGPTDWPIVGAGWPVTLTADPALVNDAPAPLWDLGNTDHRSGNPFTYAYATAGEYQIVLTATEKRCGIVRRAERMITVLPPIAFPRCYDVGKSCVNPGGPYEASMGEPITFRATVDVLPNERVLGYLWQFGHEMTSNEVSPIRSFTTPGEFGVTLNVYTTLGTQSASTSVTIRPCRDNGSCESDEGLQCRDCSGQPLCGNRSVDPGEDCSSCPRDVVGRPQVSVLPPSPRSGWPTTFVVPGDQIDTSVTPEWDFENGDVRKGNPVLYVYPISGDYQLTLTAKERNCGRLVQIQSLVRVHGPMYCDFSDLPPELHVCCGNDVCDRGENAQDCPQDCANTLSVSAGGPYRGHVGEPIQFEATVTTEPGDTVQSRLWQFGDGEVSSEVAPSHVYTTSGVHNVSLLVTTGRLHAWAPTTAVIDGENADRAQFVDHTIPDTLITGEFTDVWVRVKNVGDTTWTPGDGATSGYALAIKPGRLMPQGIRIPLPPGHRVGRNETVKFDFTIPRPPGLVIGIETISARMVREGTGWFGPELTVRIRRDADPPPGDTTIRLEPTHGAPGTVVTVRRTAGGEFAPDVSGRFSFGDPGGALYSRIGVGVTRVDASTLSFVIPDGASCGEHYFAVPPNRSNSAMFTILAPCSPNRRNTVKVLTYNIQLLPWEGCIIGPGCAKNERVPLLIQHPALQPHDVLVFQEAFSDSHRNTLVHGLRGQYPYRTDKLGRDDVFCPGGGFLVPPTVCQDGGVIILSKWPIEAVDSLIYSDCNGFDCHGQKGVLYARINKGGQRYHIFGTHLDADLPGENDWAVRERQLRQMSFFVYSIAGRARSDEPLIMAGDFNVDKVARTSDYYTMLSLLRASQPLTEGGDYTTPVRISGRAEWLDYVLFSTEYLQPVESRNTVVKPRHDSSPFPERNLSDHYAVLGTFRFDLPANLPPRVMAAPATAPLAAAPLSNTGNATPTFNWNPADGADAYTLRVTGAGGATLAGSDRLAGTSFTPTEPLPSDVDLRWHVRGHNAAGSGPDSAAVSFRIERGASSPPIGAPVPAVPGGTSGSATPTFSWSAVDGAAFYSVRVFTAEGDRVVVDETRIFGTSFTPLAELPVGVELLWSVRGESAFGPGPASPPLRFYVPGPCPAQGPVLSGNTVGLRSAADALWLNVPPGGGPVLGNTTSATPFVILQAGGASGPVHSGDAVQIRGAVGDLWLHVPIGGGPASAGPREDASTFSIESIQGGTSSGTELRLDDRVLIKGADDNSWLRVASGGQGVTGGARDQASLLVMGCLPSAPGGAPGNRLPVGWLDRVSPEGVAHGWTLDPDAPGQAIAIHLYADGPAGQGQLVGWTLADKPRPDVNQATGHPGNHGFELALPSSLRDGQPHSLYVYAIDSAAGTNPLLAGAPLSFTLAPRLPIGWHHPADCQVHLGWTCDADDFNQPLQVHFYDGPAGQGGTYIGQVTADRPREPAVGALCGENANHGFQFATPGSLRDGQPHTVYAYAINVGGAGGNPLLSGSPKTLQCAGNRPPVGHLDAVTPQGVAVGWASDPDAPTEALTVHIYSNGPAGQGQLVGAASANRPGPIVIQSTTHPGNHGFEFALPYSLLDGHAHTLFVYAIDSAGGANPLLPGSPLSFALRGQAPLGWHDASDCQFSAGWSCDADDFSQPLQVHFYDGPAGQSPALGAVVADLPRGAGVNQLCGGHPNHGFRFPTPHALLDSRPHAVHAYAINIGGPGGNPMLVGSPKILRCASDGVAVEPIVWTNAVNVAFDGTQLTNVGPAGWVSGAVSSRSIVSGAGFVEFGSLETDKGKVCGLSNGDSDQRQDDVDFAIKLDAAGQFQAREAGTVVAAGGSYTPGDRFRVEVVAGTVRYRKNGVVFHTSTLAPHYPLLVDTALNQTGATLDNVVMGSPELTTQ